MYYFADNGALLFLLQGRVQRKLLWSTGSDFGVTVRTPKTKHMVTGRKVCDGDPILVSSGSVEAVEDFPYLGSIISSSGTVDTEWDSQNI